MLVKPLFQRPLRLSQHPTISLCHRYSWSFLCPFFYCRSRLHFLSTHVENVHSYTTIATSFLAELPRSRSNRELGILCAWVAIDNRPRDCTFRGGFAECPRVSSGLYLCRLLDFADLPMIAFRLDATVGGGDPAACNSSKSSFQRRNAKGRPPFRSAVAWSGEALVKDRDLVDSALGESSSTTSARELHRRACRKGAPRGATCLPVGCISRVPTLCLLVRICAVHMNFPSERRSQAPHVRLQPQTYVPNVFRRPVVPRN